MLQIPYIAVLITCHNRKEKTLKCIENLQAQERLDIEFKIEIFLVDDGSTDKTNEAVSLRFPAVNIIQGNGNLYWNQGMRLAWETASKKREYDFYFWLNDDTILDLDALSSLLVSYKSIVKFRQNEVIITTACRREPNIDLFSYGGRNDFGPVEPNGTPQPCKYINGNAVLISKAIYKKIGNLSNDYTHGMGDFDYGLRAEKANFECYTTSDYLATCLPNIGTPGWCNPDVPLKKRWELFHSPRGLNIKEYIKFRKKFWGLLWISFTIKAYAKMLSPKLYQKIS